MLQICGKSVRDSVAELLDPSISALLVIDMQKGAVSGGGTIAESGHDMSMMPRVVQRCGEAIRAARAYGVPVFHVRVENLPDGKSSPAAWLRALYCISNGRPVDFARLSVAGDPATDFCDECTPCPGEPVITKRRPSAFIGTDLSIQLRSQGIESVAIVGISTAGCVDATLRDATHNDFYAVLIEDAVGAYDVELHEAAMKVMRARHDVCRLDQAIAVWQTANVDQRVVV